MAMLRQPSGRIAEGAINAERADQRCDPGPGRRAMPDIPLNGAREEFRFEWRQPATAETRKIDVPANPAARAAAVGAKRGAILQMLRTLQGSFQVAAVRNAFWEFAKSLRFGRVRTIRSRAENHSTSSRLPRPMTDPDSVGEPPIASDSERLRRRPGFGLNPGRSGIRFRPASIPTDNSGSA